MSPWRYTLGELHEMALARINLEWDQTALIWSTLANANRDPKKRAKPFTPDLVHPTRTAADYGRDEGPDWAVIHQLAQTFHTNRPPPCPDRAKLKRATPLSASSSTIRNSDPS